MLSRHSWSSAASGITELRLVLCIAGLDQVVIDELRRRSPAVFTGSKADALIVRPIGKAFRYEVGMSAYFIDEIAQRIQSTEPNEEVCIGLLYVAYSVGTAEFLEHFFPFAATYPLLPFYPNAQPKYQRRGAINQYVDEIHERANLLRDKIASVRAVLSGQNFSPLTLPLRNFRSDVLHPSLWRIFEQLSTVADPGALLSEGCEQITAEHPLQRPNRPNRPYFTDNRTLRFMSPGRDRHGIARTVEAPHVSACLVNSRARLGAAIAGSFHYDCTHENEDLEPAYPNCHGAQTAPSKDTHVNIAPNDAIR